MLCYKQFHKSHDRRIGTMKKISINEQRSVPVTPGMIGLFFEDINYNLDGGLHAEMIENRNFEAVKATGDWDDYHTSFDGGYGWSVWPETSGTRISVETEKPQNTVNPHYLRADVRAEGEGFTNKAYDGIYMKAGKEYIVSFYARSESFDEDIQISVKAGGETAAYGDTFIIDDGTWSQYFVSLFAEKDVEGGQFVITLSKPAVVDFDFISMMPQDALYGVFRRDLAEKLKELKPGFLRFPGGCIIEGNNLENRYQWKKSVGPREMRKYNWNRWAVHANSAENHYESRYCHYGQTLGVGYYEYFLLCEYLECKPLPVMNVGLACQYQSTEQVPMDSPEFQEFIQDALDLIEFANGPVDSTWGRLRAEMGHPESFHMDDIGIGNEQWQTEKVDFFGRYERFEKAIHEKYPEMRLIGSAGPDVQTERHRMAWDWIHQKAESSPKFVYAVDEHYYVKPQWMYENVHFYDNYPRTAKVFAGEYAAHIPNKGGRFNAPESNSFEAALAEAAFLTGVERNADVVVMASYAPLMARLGYAQWSPDLIWFDGASCYGTPSYYVQKLYSLYMGEKSLQTETAGDDLYASATYDSKGDRCIIKIVNAGEQQENVGIDCGYQFAEEAKAFLLTADDPDDCNSIDKPEKVSPKEVTVSLKDNVIEVPAQSFFVVIADVVRTA